MTGDSNKEKDGVSIHWYRHGLRTHDNKGLKAALENCEKCYPVFIFDGSVAGTSTAAYPRMSFLLECLRDLDKQFRQIGGQLFCLRGDPVEIFTHLFEEWGVTLLTFEIDPEPIWQDRDNKVKSLCEDKGVKWMEYHGHTLWNPHEIIANNRGMPPLTFKLFKQVSEMVGEPPRPEHSPSWNEHVVANLLENPKFTLPTLEDLGIYPESDSQKNPYNRYSGGETRARELFQMRMVAEKAAFASGHCMTNQFQPDLVGPPLSLSPHLRFGTLSVREFYWALIDAYKDIYPKANSPTSVTAMLVWREYFYTMSINNMNFNQMENNPICLKIKWYKNQEHLDRWTYGQTGYPWIDACMNQLRSEGWLHQVGRHMVSCFLTRGDLWLSWEDGLRVFDKYLIDADWSVCAGNWMWVSSSAFEKVLQCPKCFSPTLYGRRMDPSGEYIRRYVPKLAKYPIRYIFEPWKAPEEFQRKAGCIIGEDYPSPIVDHDEVVKRNHNMMEEIKSLCRNQKNKHCCPSDESEVRNFVWLPDHTPMGGKCSGNDLCDALENL